MRGNAQEGDSMLQNLHVKNLALIDESEVDFAGGLNILSGETGAGKSIIIGSINLALGGKVRKKCCVTRKNQRWWNSFFCYRKAETGVKAA